MISIFLAKVLGAYLVIVTSAVLLGRERMVAVFQGMESEKNEFTLYVSGALILILGLIMVNVHNIWTADYRGMITFLGWLTVFKGAARLFYGDKVVGWGKAMVAKPWHRILLWIFLLIGIWLAGIGYGFLN
ncbi:MAG: hypothetical protein WD874_00315 [Parcubacteria group bacterium]